MFQGIENIEKKGRTRVSTLDGFGWWRYTLNKFKGKKL